MNTGNHGKSRTWQMTAPDDMEAERLDRFLVAQDNFDLTRSRLHKLIADGLVLVNGQHVAKNYKLRGGEDISISIPAPPPTDLIAEDIPIDIVFEDEHLVVVNKPAGMVTHPGSGNFSGTLANALVHHFGELPQASGSERPGLVHRLDKNTSGLILVARADDVLLNLQQQMQQRRIKRTYLALVCGHMKEEQGLIDLPIGRSLKDRRKMVVTTVAGRSGQTSYRLKDRYRSYDLLEINLQTGRTHQIRVHFAHLGHPVFGDPEYGGRQKWHRGIFAPERLLAKRLLSVIDRQALHACRLQFVHPVTEKNITLSSDLPDDFAQLLHILDREGQ